MRSGTDVRASSLTAEATALVRALAGIDPYARTFLGKAMRRTLRMFQLLDRNGRSLDRASLGLYSGILARHVYLDRVLVSALANGVEQVVLLGAGFDARPWRFADRIDERPVFLVDHPATASARAGRGPAATPNVHRVDVDFDRADFALSLLGNGFKPDRRTVFIWEGVSMYLTAAAVEATLLRLGELAAPGSRLGLDALTGYHPGVKGAIERLVGSSLQLVDEPLCSIASPIEMVSLLARLGFFVREHQSVCRVPGFPQAWSPLWLFDAERRPEGWGPATGPFPPSDLFVFTPEGD